MKAAACFLVADVPAINPNEIFFKPVAATSDGTPKETKLAPNPATPSLEIPAIPPNPATLLEISATSGAVTATVFAK